ncbi:MAG TPA: hypothetical protein VFB20_07655 [Burkholderiales bacterium]|nr:hypothetical protein [Burkholderiales bacterium]
MGFEFTQVRAPAARQMALWCAALVALAVHATDGAAEQDANARLSALEATAPGLGETMAGIQLHMAKLYFAAKVGNRRLAHYEMDEIRENLERAVLQRPVEENGLRLKPLAQALETGPLARLEQAIDGGQQASIAHAYRDAIRDCNACHAATGHDFIVITMPKAFPVPNQRWTP